MKKLEKAQARATVGGATSFMKKFMLLGGTISTQPQPIAPIQLGTAVSTQPTPIAPI